MKIFTTFCVLSLLFTSVNARIWVVNNTPGSSAADFTTIQTAVDNAQDGDTLFVQGSSVAYGTIAIDKQLAIFGPGYFLDENDSTQANKYPAKTSYISFSQRGGADQLCAA